ncbi:MAG: hypothetical protein JOZ62_14680 [Acidobacteriaceae bacterium]|nr:hypothetical protein [Acidobacteriaceae bacterium]
MNLKYIIGESAPGGRLLYKLRPLVLVLTLAFAATRAKAQGWPVTGQPIGVVSPDTDKLDIFFAGPNHEIWSASWQPFGHWQGWNLLNPSGLGPLFGYVTAVSPEPDMICVLGVDSGQPFAMFSSDAGLSWFPRELVGSNFPNTAWDEPGNNAYISAVSRSPGKLDIFAAGDDNQVYTAAWDSSGWHGWWPLPGISVPQGARLAAASPTTDTLVICASDTNGYLFASRWSPSSGGWSGWQHIPGVQASGPVSAISRAPSQLELFVTDVNGKIQTTTLTNVNGQIQIPTKGWQSIGVARRGAIVTGVSRSPWVLDIFVAAFDDGQVWTNSSFSLTFSASSTVSSWTGWRPIPGFETPPGSAVSVVSRSHNNLDAYVGGKDGNVWTAAWAPDGTDWHVFQVAPPNSNP